MKIKIITTEYPSEQALSTFQYSIHPIKRKVRLAFRAIFYTQNTVRLIGILEIFTNSTFNRDAGQCRTNFFKLQYICTNKMT